MSALDTVQRVKSELTEEQVCSLPTMLQLAVYAEFIFSI
jgi:hypothetical protein